MALNGTTEGDAMATAVSSNAPSAGTPVTTAQLKAIWEAIGQANVTHFTTNAVVNPGTFSNGGGAVTGAGTLS